MAAAPFRDRVVPHAIVRVIEPIFERRFIADSYACRRGKRTHAATRRAAQFARRWPYAIKCDVRKYFPSIDHEVLLVLLLWVIGDPRLMIVVRRVHSSCCRIKPYVFWTVSSNHPVLGLTTHPRTCAGPGGPGALPPRGSHRSVRARTRAYGSSNHGFAACL